MTPKHLYIPTCSQNFNSIMSSESISPAGFYERRNFGMKRFLRVEANKLNDRIALYQNIPEFHIPSTDEENFPIYIRIDTSCYDEELFYESGIDGIYYCDQTIYITPYSCGFFFYNDANYRVVYSSQRRSLTTKMTRLYAKSFFPIKNPIQVQKYDYSLLRESGKDFSNHIAFDRRINKLKGFYLAYLIGVMKDMSYSVVKLYHLTNQLSDVLDSALTNTHNPINQSLYIETLYDSLNKVLREQSNEKQMIEEAIAKDSQQYRIEGDILNYIISHGWYNDWKHQKHIPETYQVEPLLLHRFSVTCDNEYKEQHINNILQHINALRGQKYPNIDEMPIIQQSTLTGIPESGFLEFVYRETMKEIYNSLDFIDNRYSFSIAICKQYKSIVTEEEFSVVRGYLNALNNNLLSHTEFNINSYDDEDFLAYAAFCQKGDPDDFGKLEDYLINSEIPSLHKSLAIAGMVFGYADMPKTFTECFTHNLNHAFIKTHYRHLTQCIGINVSHVPVDSIEIKDKDLTTPTNPKLREEVHKVIAPLKPSDKTVQKIDEALEVESRQFDPQAFLEILNNLISTRSKIYKTLKEELLRKSKTYNSISDFRNDVRRIYSTIGSKNQKQEYWEAIETSLELEAKVSDPRAFIHILDDHLGSTHKAYGVLKKYFGDEKQQTSKTTKEPKLPFPEERPGQSRDALEIHHAMPQSTLFVKDPDVYNVIKHLLPNDNEVRNQVKKDLQWFIDNHQPTFINETGQPAFYGNKPIDNESTIKSFEAYAHNRLQQKQSWIVNRWRQIDIPKVVEYLRSIYK